MGKLKRTIKFTHPAHMQSIHTITYRLFYPPKEYLALVRLEIAAKLQKKSEVCKKNLQKSEILWTFYLFFVNILTFCIFILYTNLLWTAVTHKRSTTHHRILSIFRINYLRNTSVSNTILYRNIIGTLSEHNRVCNESITCQQQLSKTRISDSPLPPAR